MRLYYHPFSSNSRKALMTALHLGVKTELVVVNLAQGEQRGPNYLNKNPNGKVPLLEDGSLLLWESHAIMIYLAEITAGQTLYPQDAGGRADVNRWLFWSAYHFTPGIGVLNFEWMVKRIVGGGEPDPVEVRRGNKLVSDAARILDAHLAGRQWVLHDRLTLADFALAAPLMSSADAKLPVAEFGNLQSWFSRIKELPEWRDTNPPEARVVGRPG
jgi:glutathione S-transferase